MITRATRTLATLSTFLVCTHFGLFLAWVCTTMWGLDAADPRAAIAAMQAMNASVRNLIFAPVFFGAPVALLVTAMVIWRSESGYLAGLFAASGGLVLIGSVFVTMTVNVPMNADLGQVTVPKDIDAARAIWAAYSPNWQFWNQFRTAMSGIAALLALIALQMQPRRTT